MKTTRSSNIILPPTARRRVLLIGGGAREHALGEALCRSGRVELYVFAHNENPGLQELACEFREGSETDVGAIVSWAQERQIEFAVIGLEDPLAVGLPDQLQAAGIPTVGPVQAAARLETSKLFLRQLMDKYRIAGNLEHHLVSSPAELESTLTRSGRQFALKPVGLTAGKGVKVMGVQLNSLAEAIEYGNTVIKDRIGGDSAILLEERVQGPEFTLQAFVDGYTVVPMPLVKDYKLAYEGDHGPNTGSMGSYSEANGQLGFVSWGDRQEALRILESIVSALRDEGACYKGVLYGQFMSTCDGIRLIEINARFGDPESINVLSLLQTDFVDVCDAILKGTLADLTVAFARQATVCKYLTPPGYPTDPKTDQPLAFDLQRMQAEGVKVFFAKVSYRNGAYVLTKSRSVAVLGIAATVEEAHLMVERALIFAPGFHVRHDIGTKPLMEHDVQGFATARSDDAVTA